MAFSRDNQRIVSGSNDETIRIWDATTGHCLRVISYKRLCRAEYHRSLAIAY
ncbi:hypothetical protein PQG02_05585 [Nostoc sp. UHCC 0926]|uniref:WD40 repeat domain-containing protein n=1 Tax=unclassified Nostoc TaxID=2593658 RepID=UPI00235F05EB|nr:hypothetical protein [Nostoc sp. UHCC 0926]WDD32924.1 hypothetical protein PQG02_30760 [Nostoc sp. UHCC 0926]WDD33843.1 hypothetical protein PQG02_05585 [Nostoc sp. UHCC 0926]